MRLSSGCGTVSSTLTATGTFRRSRRGSGTSGGGAF
jgi:hypothetical protein